MAVNLYDVNFNQFPDGESFSSMPAISGYIIDDEGFENRITFEGKINDSNIISSAGATNNIQGAVSMDRFRITTETGEIVTCRLLPDGNNCVGTIINDEIAQVYICDSNGIVIESLSIPYNENSSNISFIGHFDSNDEIDWISIACQDSELSLTIINTTGFSSTVFNLLKDYIYLKYKYKYQVVIQKSLKGSNDFQITRLKGSNKKIWGTGENQSNKYNEVVYRIDDDLDIYDVSASWWRYPPVSTAPQWYNNYTVNQLALAFGDKYQNEIGSDLTRLLPDGKFYSGLDCDNNNLAWHTTVEGQPNYEIPFSGGKLRFTMHSFSRWVQLLDKDENLIDEYQLPYPVSGGASSIPTGQIGQNLGRYGGVGNIYLCEENTKYFLVGLVCHPYYDDKENQIILSSYTYGTYYTGIAYQKLYEFSDKGNNILFKATENEKIVPADPDNLTADEVENQTTDSDIKNEYGEEIPIPKYSEGEWSDKSTDGVRGSGRGVPTGENSESKLDKQPDLPALPSIPSAVSTGFIKLYNPTDSEISALGRELTSDSALNILNKFFGNNPLDFIVGLQVVPGNFEIDESMKYHINYGSYNSSVGMYKITNENCVINYGTLELKETYGSWEDYNPHTRMMIYLPYIGIRDIDPDRIQGTRLNLKYYVNAITGSILAVLTSTRVDSDNKGAELLVGQWSGQASYTIPLTNTQHNSAVNAVIGVVSAGIGIGAGIATGGLSVPATVGLAGNALLSGAKATKTDLTMQGGVSGSLSFFTGHDAYIQIEYPKEGRPTKYDHIIGKPSNLTTDIKHQPLNNYIEFVEIDVANVSAPNEEKQMIVNMLKGGIYT